MINTCIPKYQLFTSSYNKYVPRNRMLQMYDVEYDVKLRKAINRIVDFIVTHDFNMDLFIKIRIKTFSRRYKKFPNLLQFTCNEALYDYNINKHLISQTSSEVELILGNVQMSTYLMKSQMKKRRSYQQSFSILHNLGQLDVYFLCAHSIFTEGPVKTRFFNDSSLQKQILDIIL